MINEMMELEEDVSDWIKTFVSQPNQSLGYEPCPYAQAALDKGKIHWCYVEHKKDIAVQLYQYATFNKQFWDRIEVIVIGIKPDMITAKELEQEVDEMNTQELLPRGFIALPDHPDDKEIINGVEMNQGKWALILLQSKDKLNLASRKLDRLGYYDNWSKSNKEDVFKGRY